MSGKKGRGIGVSRNRGPVVGAGFARAAALAWAVSSAMTIGTFALPADADVVGCALRAEPRGRDMGLSLSMSPSYSGMSPFACPGASRLTRTAGSESAVITATWPIACRSEGASSCSCGEYVDRGVPCGAVEYKMVDSCGTTAWPPQVETMVVEGCDAEASGGGCECTASAPTLSFGLPLLLVLVCLGLVALRRDGRR